MEKITWTEQARDDLKLIYEYISKDSTKYADITVDNIIEITERLVSFPFSGRNVPEFRKEDIREIIYGNYRIIYQVTSDYIIILTVFHSARLFNSVDFNIFIDKI
jgi:toxin ParE1/3/4